MADKLGMYGRWASRTAPALILMVALASVITSATQPAATDELSAVGRLATVEPAKRRVTMVADGESKQTELILDPAARVLQGDVEITLSDLVGMVGNRVT